MDKFRRIEDEMSRFEAEISGQTLNAFGPAFINFANMAGPPQHSILIPHQVGKKLYNAPLMAQPAVVSAKPTIYHVKTPKPPVQTAVAPSTSQQPSVDFLSLQSEVEKKLKKLKSEKVSAELAISQGKASSALQSFGPEDYKRKGTKNRKLLRTAGGQTWEDTSLADWPDDDFRIFCGDLGNDVTDELLTRTFNKFSSFQRARVIRDKRTNKTKGYGFVSFKDPADFTRAMKEMNGRYVGSRPIKLRKSSWRTRCIDVVKKKEKEKAALISLLTSNGR